MPRGWRSISVAISLSKDMEVGKMMRTERLGLSF